MRRDNGGYKPPKGSMNKTKGSTRYEFWNKPKGAVEVAKIKHKKEEK